MRLVTWNICRGTYATRINTVRAMQPDVAVLQECPRVGELLDPRDSAWFGANPRQGVAVVTSNGFKVDALDAQTTGSANTGRSAYAARITGPLSFNLLAIWAQSKPTYARALQNEFDAYRQFLRGGPVVVIGDFNTNGPYDANDRRVNHSSLVHRLAGEFGLVSAYHEFFNEPQGCESRPTLYWRWQQAKPFHCDYCFIPRSWTRAIESVRVRSYDEETAQSDHRAVTVDVDLERIVT